MLKNGSGPLLPAESLVVVDELEAEGVLEW